MVIWSRLVRRRRLRAAAKASAVHGMRLGVVNPADVPRPRRRSPDIGVVRPAVDETPRIVTDLL